MFLVLFQLLTYLLLLSFDGRLALSVAEVATLLGLSEKHVWAQLKSGAIPSIRLGRRVLIPVSGLEQLLDSTQEGGDHV